MPKYLVYLDISQLRLLDDALGDLVDSGEINEYFTLTEDGEPLYFEHGMVGDPEFCNGLAMRCAGITEE
jgi:hypothetical protein